MKRGMKRVWPFTEKSADKYYRIKLHHSKEIKVVIFLNKHTHPQSLEETQVCQ